MGGFGIGVPGSLAFSSGLGFGSLVVFDQLWVQNPQSVYDDPSVSIATSAPRTRRKQYAVESADLFVMHS